MSVATPIASAVPPANDNYLASTTIGAADGGLPREYRDAVDTSEATTQADTFDPNRDGQPFGGGEPEPTTCGSTTIAKTVWYDFRPSVTGGVQINAAGFDTVVAVYEWSATTSRITRTVTCRNAGIGEEVLLPIVSRNRNYTVQAGGANGAGGQLDFQFAFFPDRDGDGVLDDEPDKCRTRPGIRAFGGCPPELRSAPRIRYDRVAGGIRVTNLAIDDVPRGARAEVRCGRCGRRVSRRASRTGVLTLGGFAGRFVRSGDRIEVRITLGRTGDGRFRFGAVGRYYRWPVVGSSLGDRVSRCLQPGSRRPSRCR